MKLLITGGAGFIGSAVIRHIIRNTEYEVINLDKLTYAGNLDSLLPVSESSKYFFEQVDICDVVELERVFNTHKPSSVMHLAAESHVDRSIDGPSDFIQTNIVGTYCLLEASRKYFGQLSEKEKSLFKFHHVSTDEVYGGWPKSGEIDIMEATGQADMFAFGTLHYGQPWPANEWTSGRILKQPDAWSDDFHVYAVEWEANEIRCMLTTYYIPLNHRLV